MAPDRLGDNLLGAGLMMAMAAGFSTNDAFVKSVSDEVPLFQAVFLRGLIATVLLAALAWRQGALRVPPSRRDRRLIAVRSLAEIGGTVTFLTALFHMPIADATAILQAVPLVVTLAAALIFAEPVGWRRYAAIAVGFIGVLILVRPGSSAFTAYALWAVGALVFIVARDLVTRSLSPGMPGIAVAAATSTALTAFAGVMALATDWQPVTVRHVAHLAIAALGLMAGYICGIGAMRIGEIGFTQPFRYTLLIWAMFFGIVMFGEWPDAWMLLGSAVVVATGLFTFYRERKIALGEG